MADSVARTSWKEAAGRTDGHEGYRFGDLTRSTIKNVMQWSESDKFKDGYHFGDLFLKDLVKSVVGGKSKHDSGSFDVGPAPTVSGVTAEHTTLARDLSEKRQKAAELLGSNLPRLEQRLQQLEGKQVLNGVEKTQLFCINGTGKPPRPIDTYKSMSSQLKGILDIPLDASFVRQAERVGELGKIEAGLSEALEVAEQCARCADDVCPHS